MNNLPFYLVDAFADKPFGGNAAGVVPDAETLDEGVMQKIARELHQSETAFLMKSDNPAADFRVRYFTPAEEINFCGHATVGAAWLLAQEFGWRAERVVLETNIGLVPVTFDKADGALKSVTMTQVAPRTKEIPVDRDEIARLVGIAPTDLDDRYPIRLAHTGNWHLLVPVKTRQAIDSAQPLLAELGAMNRSLEASTTHLFSFDTGDDAYDLYTRDFCPAIGIPEDPVTGAANGALAGYLVLERILPPDQPHALTIAQGHAIGRPGTLSVKVTPGPNGPVIQVGGAARVMACGNLRI
ncbi:PhzF family phenazine biosynthesis protein [Brevibacillus sp. SYP-B805]|uniref:PhzF family phenazine biosynthesis protein n=1 Tax=Brevibacillus sp. SYP-B805 TaxID=1578199 RepID=UPI0013EE1E13|nr:PhzF family phenazine biosynthesis protein [Brevibacillus sp. SYP-B805]NGQ94386.1 PhzF family phenazine biosynthesis protein [Brevibacillus sp. SYP-B805]